jgi:thioredoxin-like negative regulator of GroEL
MTIGKVGQFVLLFLMALSLLHAQSWRGQGRLKGVIVDQDGRPLEGVMVKLFSVRGQSGFEVMTNAQGEWFANYIRGGGWDINMEKTGYLPKTITTNIIEVTNNPAIQTQLQKVEGLVITAEIKAELIAGNKLFEEKQYEAAAAAYANILAKNPDIYIVYLNIGNCYFELQKYDLAEEAYKKILEKDPKNAEALLLVGNCYSNRGDNEKAMDWYGQIAYDKIRDQMVLFNIGSKFYSQSKFDEALRYYAQAVEIQPDFTDAIYQVGLTHLAMNRYKEAIGVFENYLKYDPDSERAGQVRGFIEFLKTKI